MWLETFSFMAWVFTIVAFLKKLLAFIREGESDS